jgi:hypothetical protein
MAAGRPFEGIFTIFENIVAAIGEKTGALVMRIGEGLSGHGASGGEKSSDGGGALGYVTNAVGNFFGKSEPEHAVEPIKLGGNALKQELCTNATVKPTAFDWNPADTPYHGINATGAAVSQGQGAGFGMS